MTKIQAVFILFVILKWMTLAIKYESKEDNHDLKVALSDNFIVGTSNLKKTFMFYSISNVTQNSACTIKNPHSELNIYSLSILTMNHNNIVSFVQLAENKTSTSVVLSRVTMNLTTCDNDSKQKPVFQHTIVWTKDHQEHIFLKVDPQEKFAYIFADSFILSYDLFTNQINQINKTNSIVFGNNYGSFTPYAFDLKNDWAAVTGFCLTHNNSRSKPYLYIFGLQPLHVISVSAISTNDIQGSERITYNQDYDMSLSINPSGTTLVIGEVQLNKVTIAYMDGNNTFLSVSRFHEISEPENWTGFGRSITWLYDDETLAILVLKLNNHDSTESEIQVYKNISRNRTPGSIIPSYTIPNNQQTLNGIHRSKSSRKHSFRRIRTRSNNFLIQLRNSDLVYVPSADPGLCSMELVPINFLNLYVLQPRPCVSGSYKNSSGPGPCTVCPPSTKNSGGNPSIKCQPCNSNVFCPLGASDDVNLTDFNSYIQTFNYPDTPVIDDYDDLLLLNFFPTNIKGVCLVYTPLFWAFLALVLCLTIWFIMFLIKRRRSTSADIYRQRAKLVFKHTDLIGQGERWIGGLASVVIFTIIVYCAVFASFYFYSYPIETTEAIDKTCGNSKRNTKFDNALQLPLPGTDGTYWKIFNMLDKQPFTMTIHLINTRAQCSNIIVKRNRRMGTPLSRVETNCTLSSNNVSGSLSFGLPTHKSIVRVGISGPYFIGALRLCLSGNSAFETEDFALHRLHELDVCTLLYTSNQTIGLSTTFSVRLIKMINVTKPLKRSDRTYYDGIWAPVTTYTDVISDESYFAEKGEYLRYTSKQTIINVQFREEIYFVQNNQSPIIRRGALFFHTVLFSFSLIEIFAMVFLLYKLWFHPIRRRIITSYDDLAEDEFQSHETPISIDSKSELPQSSKLQTLSTIKSTNDRYREHWRRNRKAKTNQNLHKRHRTKDSVRVSKNSGVVEYVDTSLSSPPPVMTSMTTSGDVLSDNSVPEYADQIKRLTSDVAAMKDEIDKLIQENQYLKEHNLEIL